MERNVREQEKRAAEETMLCSFQNLINFEDKGKVCDVILGLPLHREAMMVDLDQLEGVRESKSPSLSPNFSLSLSQLQTVSLCNQSSTSSTTKFQSPESEEKRQGGRIGGCYL